MTKKRNPSANDQKSASTAQLRYTNGGRSGTIHYVSQKASFDMWYELAGGSALAIINVPTPEHWEALTKTPLTERDAILQFIGEQVLRDQVSTDGYFLTDDNFITLYTGKNPNL